MNWISLGLRVFSALPKIQATIESVKGIKGREKKDAAVTAIVRGLGVAETIAEKQILSDPRVVTVVERANDVLVEAQNTIAIVAREIESQAPTTITVPAISTTQP